MAIRPPLINIMTKAAYKAGRDLTRDFGELDKLQVSRKSVADFVTSADLWAEKNLKKILGQAYPTFGFISEESEPETGEDEDTFWVIDPLDGTTNYLHAIPHFSISIAVMRKGVITDGIVYDPIKNELFWASKGEGAYVNDQRLRVSARKVLNEAVLATGIPHVNRGNPELFTKQLTSVMPVVGGIRRMGSAALDLAYVAAGRFEGFWEMGLSIWDVAAGSLLVTEAGGFITELDGRKFDLESGKVLATNEALNGQLTKLFSGVAK